MSEYDQSLLYHSIRIYDGTIFRTTTVPYRIGNNVQMIQVEEERYFDTWNDFKLIPSERPVIATPKANTKLVTIPGKKDPIDLTNYLTGHPTFGNRTGSITFFINNDWVEENGGWVICYHAFIGLFNGHIVKVVLRDDPAYFYAGELTVNQWSTGDQYSMISFGYNFYPYKKDILSSMELWEWDDFRFEDGIIQYLKDIEVNGTRIIKVFGSLERISPHMRAAGIIAVDKYENDAWVTYGNVPTNDITSNDSIVPRLIINDGENLLRFRGNGSVSIDYRRGLL